MNRSAFYVSARARSSGIFGTSLSQAQVDGCEAILNGAEKRATPLRQLAYILATAYHESAHTMQAVRETLATTDDGAIRALEKAWKAGKLSWVRTPYWRKDADGKSWFGRGLVQITHKANYQKLGLLIGADLVKNPSKALEISTAVQIIFTGMELGSFTGKALDDYITDGHADYEGARRIVNGTDKAALIATYAKAFEKVLVSAGYKAVKAGLGAAPKAPEPSVLQPKTPDFGIPPPIAQGPVPRRGWLAALVSIVAKLFKGKQP